MAKVSENALRLAGFLLAHATWIISDLGPEEEYVPQVLCLSEGELVLNVFEADTQVEAIAKGQAFMETQAARFDGCAFARDGLVRTDKGPVDVLTIGMADETGAAILVMIQPYSKTGTMRLLGDETVLSPDGSTLDETATKALRPIIREGAQSHSAALQNWRALDASRLPAPVLFERANDL